MSSDPYVDDDIASAISDVLAYLSRISHKGSHEHLIDELQHVLWERYADIEERISLMEEKLRDEAEDR